MVHKQHHEFAYSISLASQSCHPLEFAISDNFSPFSGVMLIGSKCHSVTLVTYHIYRILDGFEIHSGYEFPWSIFNLIPFGTDASYHDYHHSHNVGNFASSLTIWDTVFNSNKAYYESDPHGTFQELAAKN